MKNKEKLEEAKRLYESANADQKYVLESLFPELCESEDERIRKALIKLVKKAGKGYENVIDGVSIENAIAWLEKQGTSYTKRDVDEAFVEGMACAKNELEKQSEQKSVDKVEPKFKVKYAGSEYNVFETKDIAGVTFYGIEDEPNHIDYVKADNCEIINGGYGIKENGCSFPTKPIMFSEQNLAWSEYDMSKVQRICKYLDEAKKYYADITEVRDCMNWLKSLKDKMQPQPKQEWSEQEQIRINRIVGCLENLNVADNDILLKDVDWLKSLKDRVQPKQEWNKGDMEMLNAAISFVEHSSFTTIGKGKNNTVAWLKSLKNRYTWKPSKGQLECLGYAIDKAEKDYSPLANNRIYLTLKALKKELEKLTE